MDYLEIEKWKFEVGERTWSTTMPMDDEVDNNYLERLGVKKY